MQIPITWSFTSFFKFFMPQNLLDKQMNYIMSTSAKWLQRGWEWGWELRRREKKNNSLVEGEEKERGWNLVRVRMERDCKKIFHHEGWEMTGWQQVRGGRRWWYRNRVITSLLFLCHDTNLHRRRKKNTQRKAEMIWCVTQAKSINLKSNFLLLKAKHRKSNKIRNSSQSNGKVNTNIQYTIIHVFLRRLLLSFSRYRFIY